MTGYSEHGAIPVEDAVVGEFNDGSHTALEMERADGGRWSATIELPPGRYRFRHLIGGDVGAVIDEHCGHQPGDAGTDRGHRALR